LNKLDNNSGIKLLTL